MTFPTESTPSDFDPFRNCATAPQHPKLIKSRLATSIVFGYYGRSKVVIKVLIILSKKSRAFIIS